MQQELQELEISIGDLFQYLNIDNNKYNETQTTDKEIYIKTDTGKLTPILGYVKKEKKPIYKCTFKTDNKIDVIEVADTHIFRYKNKEIFAKDSLGLELDGLNGTTKVIDIEENGIDDVYDISIAAPHWYVHNDEFGNGLISHNTLLCAHCATYAATNGHNVAVFSFEDGEFGWSSRIDANLMNTTLDDMKSKGLALSTVFNSVISDGMGRIKLKEYPPRGASAKHIRAQLDDWRIKDDFIPALVIIDAINIASPVQQTDNMYQSGKLVAEDFRAIAVDYNVPVISPSQAGRASFGAKDMGMADSAESIGIPQTADIMISFISDPTRPDIRIMSILKSRSIDKQKTKPVIVNCSTEHQRLWDLEDNQKRAYLKAENKEAIHNMEKIVEVAETISKTEGDINDDLLSKMLNGNY